MQMTIKDIIYAYGHHNILCTHDSTIELTKDKTLTRKGNCILGVNASKACFDLNPELKELIKKGKKVKITIKIENLIENFYGYGHKDLKLLDTKDIVFRKSTYTCNRTVLISCTKSSSDLNRELIEKIKGSKEKFIIILEVV